MEIHQHSHTPRKKWTHYFWEFLMLFLAVFCGFFAENQREHMIEHRREKDFMSSMLNDIRTDTAMLVLMHKTFANVANNIDSLIPLLQLNNEMDKNVRNIYQHQVMLNLFARWRYSDRTISQLKNSGNFRLIRKKIVSDWIINYDGYVKSYVDDMQSEYILPLWRAMNDASTEIFQAGVFRKYFKSGNREQRQVKLPGKPYFLSAEKYKLQRFINQLEQYAVAIEWGNINIKNALDRAVTLDSLIKIEYHLK